MNSSGQISEALVPRSIGDCMLYALSAHRNITIQTFKRYFFELLNSSDARPDKKGFYKMLRSLEVLGHCNRSEERLIVNLPQIAVLDSRTAVLVGNRTESTSAILNQAVRMLGGSCELRHHEKDANLFTTEFHICLPRPQDYAVLAQKLRIGICVRNPDLDVCALMSLHDKAEALRWHQTQRLNWQRKDFSLDTFRLTTSELDDPEPALSQFKNLRTNQTLYRVFSEGKYADCEREWGILWLCKETGVSPLFYDATACVLAVPYGVLPLSFERVLVQASGIMPPVVEGRRSVFYSYYGNITARWAEMIAAKFDQKLQEKALVREGV
jgi:hypothetical protein